MTMNDPKGPKGNPRPTDAVARKKRRRTASSDSLPTTGPEPARRRVAPSRSTTMEAASSWTGGHVAMALIAGLSAGAVGGYYMRGAGDPNVAKDAAGSAAAQGQARPGVSGRPAQPDPGPVYIPLASYTPRKGPEHAKVTILEFSDFQ
jgi:protein-disulfide isomerase